MKLFRDEDGLEWEASVRERPGRDYKGRCYFFLKPHGCEDRDGIALLDVRWNAGHTAQRTLDTMSDVELRRRLRSARGRGRPDADLITQQGK
jgi:hypothetical protein